MKRIFVLFVIALFFAACPAQHEVTQVGNPNLDETQDVTQITNPPGPLTETEGLTQVGSPTTLPGGGGEGLGGAGGGSETEAALVTKALLVQFPKWAGTNFDVMFNVSDMKAIINSSIPECSSIMASFKINEDGSVETIEPGCQVKGRPDEVNSDLKVIGSDGTTLATLAKVTMDTPKMMKNAKDAAPAKQFMDKKYQNWPKAPSDETPDKPPIPYNEVPGMDKKSKVVAPK